ncbi:MAG: polysaccharide deacetylase family protein [bacterium]|nr:polysaccharide deacetylase family protein [bacterium]
MFRIGNTYIPVLVYHNIGQYRDLYTITPVLFEQQMSFLYNYGFSPLIPADLIHYYIGTKPLPRKPILLTFDDGYRSFLTHALPILSKYGFYCLVFVVTQLIGKLDYFNNPSGKYQLLSKVELIEPSRLGIHFGSHSATHRPLTLLEKDELLTEIAYSKHSLEDIIGKPICFFAYPYGASNECIRKMVKAAGYRFAFTNRFTLNEPFEVGRILIGASDNSCRSRLKISPLYPFIKNILSVVK